MAHRCGIWLIAHSSVGKDNALAVHRLIVEQLRASQPPLPNAALCFNELTVGRLTYSGLLQDVDAGRSPDRSTHWLTWTNSEISQCFRGGENYIAEQDFCQLAEGEAIGKRTKSEKVGKRVHFWFAIGAHPKALAKYFGTSENGRLRGFAAYINKQEVMAISLTQKLAEHSHSLSRT